MAETWTVNQSDCSKIHLLNGSDDNDAIWIEKTWHEISPTQAATLPSGTKMIDANGKKLTLLDGYCTTYFYKGWQTVSAMIDNKIGNIIDAKNGSFIISSTVGPTVAELQKNVDFSSHRLQIVRLPNGIIVLPYNIIDVPNNSGEDLFSDLYRGIVWGTKRDNWYKQWDITPLLVDGYSISDQLTTFPRTFTIDDVNLPGYGNDEDKSYYAPELFAPYMYLRNQNTNNGIYVGGIIVVIGVKKLS